MIRALITYLMLILTASVAVSAPPEPPAPSDLGEVDSVLGKLEGLEAFDSANEQFQRARELQEMANNRAKEAMDQYQVTKDLDQSTTTDLKGMKFSEIRIDDEGIRAVTIDENGKEHVFERAFVGGGDELPEAPRPGSGKTAIVKVGEDVFVAYDEKIDGDIICMGCNVTVDGVVDGTIFSTGSVTLGPNAIATGDVVAKRMQSDPGAEVGGRFIKASIGDFPFPGGTDAGLPGLFTWLMVTIYIMVFSFLVMVIFRRPVDRIKFHVKAGPFKMFLIGFLMILGIGPFFVLLCITIVGIPVAVLIYPFAIVAAVVLGTVGTAQYLGELVGRRSGSLRFTSRYLTAMIGVLTFTLLWLISGFFESTRASTAAGVFFGFGTAAVSAVVCTGIGAIWFSRFGTRPKDIDNCACICGPTQSGDSGGETTISSETVQE